MAGREFSGFDYAKDDLFENASMILTPAPGTNVETIQFAKDFFLSLGFGRVRFSTPAEHDEMIALTSQLAHIVSSAYVKSPLARKHKGVFGGQLSGHDARGAPERENVDGAVFRKRGYALGRTGGAHRAGWKAISWRWTRAIK